MLRQDKETIDFGDLAFGGGAPGVHAAFQLHIALPDSLGSSKPRAWLIWRGNRKSELAQTRAPFQWLPFGG